MAVEFVPVAPRKALLVQGYAPEGYRVAGSVHAGGILIAPEAVHPWAATDLASIDPGDFTPLLGAQVLLLGTGQAMRRPPADLLAALAAQDFAVDFMDSRAAARTYNVLVVEGRSVAAALLPL